MSSTVRRKLLLVLAIGFFVASALMVEPLVRKRERYGLTSNPVRGASPHLVLATNVFGWARGIIMDVIWIRMEELQREGRHFEVNQLAEWACELSPRVPEVWDIQGWNMAYNVSCTLEYLPDRWAWVWSGISLVRDEGIPNNPNAYDLYFSLAWMLHHKVGQQDDNAHMFYKERFALEMQDVLGGPGDWQTLVLLESAPTSSDELMSDPQVAEIVEFCREHDFDIVEDYFHWYHSGEAGYLSPRAREVLDVAPDKELVPQPVAEKLQSIDEPYPELEEDLQEEVERRVRLLANERNPLKEERELQGVPEDVRDDPLGWVLEARFPTGIALGLDQKERQQALALKKIDLFARSRRLRREFNMRPDRMLNVLRFIRMEARQMLAREKAYAAYLEENPAVQARPETELMAILEDFLETDISRLPVDWRSPYPHSMYWALEGLEKVNEAEAKRRLVERELGQKVSVARMPGQEGVQEAEGLYEYSRSRLLRLVYLSLQSLVQHGRILFDTSGGFLYEVGPEYRLAAAALPIFDKYHRQLLDYEMSQRMRSGPQQAYLNFLERSIAEYHFLGNDEKSKQYYELLSRRYPDRRYNHNTYEEYLKWKVSDYESAMTFSNYRTRYRGFVMRAIVAWAEGDDERAGVYEARAKAFYKAFDEEEQEVERARLLAWTEIWESMVVDMLAGSYEQPGSERMKALQGKLRERLKEEWTEQRFAELMDAVERARGQKGIRESERLDEELLREGHKRWTPDQMDTGLDGDDED